MIEKLLLYITHKGLTEVQLIKMASSEIKWIYVGYDNSGNESKNRMESKHLLFRPIFRKHLPISFWGETL